MARKRLFPRKGDLQPYIQPSLSFVVSIRTLETGDPRCRAAGNPFQNQGRFLGFQRKHRSDCYCSPEHSPGGVPIALPHLPPLLQGGSQRPPLRLGICQHDSRPLVRPMGIAVGAA